MSAHIAKHEKKDKLLDQGVMLLMEKGYHGTGLKEILDTVQIPKGSFYTYFDSKEQFAAEVVSHYIEPYIERLSAKLQEPDLDGLTALRQYYSQLIADVINADFKGGCLLGNLMGEIGDTSSLCRQAMLEAIQRYCALQESALLRAQQQGRVRTDKTAAEMADLLFNAWQGALLRMKVMHSEAPLLACLDELLDGYFRPVAGIGV